MRLSPLILCLLAVSAWGRDYHAEAVRLKALSHRRSTVPQIEKTLKVIDWSLKKHFPNGEYSRTDIIALVLGESAFYPKETGGRGDTGLFQVLRPCFRRGLNPYDIRVNTEYGFRVLKSKHKRFGYKNGIIAYNGLVRDKRTGQIKGHYWQWFQHNRRRVEVALRTKHKTNHRKSCAIAKLPAIPVKPKIVFNAELARQFEEARKLQIEVYGG